MDILMCVLYSRKYFLWKEAQVYLYPILQLGSHKIVKHDEIINE